MRNFRVLLKDHAALVISLALAFFAVLRILWVAHFDAAVALTLLQVGDRTQLLVATLVLALTGVASALLAFPEALIVAWGRLRSWAVGPARITLAVFAAFAMTPAILGLLAWPLFLTAAVLLVLEIRIQRRRRRAAERASAALEGTLEKIKAANKAIDKSEDEFRRIKGDAKRLQIRARWIVAHSDAYAAVPAAQGKAEEIMKNIEDHEKRRAQINKEYLKAREDAETAIEATSAERVSSVIGIVLTLLPQFYLVIAAPWVPEEIVVSRSAVYYGANVYGERGDSTALMDDGVLNLVRTEDILLRRICDDGLFVLRTPASFVFGQDLPRCAPPASRRAGE